MQLNVNSEHKLSFSSRAAFGLIREALDEFDVEKIENTVLLENMLSIAKMFSHAKKDILALECLLQEKENSTNLQSQKKEILSWKLKKLELELAENKQSYESLSEKSKRPDFMSFLRVRVSV